MIYRLYSFLYYHFYKHCLDKAYLWDEDDAWIGGMWGFWILQVLFLADLVLILRMMDIDIALSKVIFGLIVGSIFLLDMLFLYSKKKMHLGIIENYQSDSGIEKRYSSTTITYFVFGLSWVIMTALLFAAPFPTK